MITNEEIAAAAALKPIDEVANQLGLGADVLERFGKYKAKLPLDLIDESRIAKSKLILVSAMSPTPAGEGKTTTSVGLAMAMNKLGKQTTAVLREPSLGPFFGMKGGATGGGYSQVVPAEDINLHFNGDFNAIEKAHNLLSAMVDNELFHRRHIPNLNPRTLRWKRVMDMNDRALRNIVIGLNGQGVTRESGFDITAASEVMAIMCMAKDEADLQDRLGRILIGSTTEKEPVCARDLQAVGAMKLLLNEAVKPNLVQTMEHTPAIIHGGPFANIAQGTNTVIATRMGMSLSDYVVTEAGFGFDLGGEKFLDIKCPSAGLAPSAVVMVATVRALKFHGGVKVADLDRQDMGALERGFSNLAKHLENVKHFGLPAVVAINRFPSDTEAELEWVMEQCRHLGARAAVSEVFGKGGDGGMALAEALSETLDENTADFRPLYPESMPVREKIEMVARRIYGAGNVHFSKKANRQLDRIDALGMNHFPVCIAKTQYSFSDDPSRLGSPEGFEFNIREIEIAAGAGFIVPISGEMMRMPGLPRVPAAVHM